VRWTHSLILASGAGSAAAGSGLSGLLRDGMLAGLARLAGLTRFAGLSLFLAELDGDLLTTDLNLLRGTDGGLGSLLILVADEVEAAARAELESVDLSKLLKSSAELVLGGFAGDASNVDKESRGIIAGLARFSRLAGLAGSSLTGFAGFAGLACLARLGFSRLLIAGLARLAGLNDGLSTIDNDGLGLSSLDGLLSTVLGGELDVLVAAAAAEVNSSHLTEALESGLDGLAVGLLGKLSNEDPGTIGGTKLAAAAGLGLRLGGLSLGLAGLARLAGLAVLTRLAGFSRLALSALASRLGLAHLKSQSRLTDLGRSGGSLGGGFDGSEVNKLVLAASAELDGGDVAERSQGFLDIILGSGLGNTTDENPRRGSGRASLSSSHDGELSFRRKARKE